DTMEADVDDLQQVGKFLARHGVTAWLPTLVPGEEEQYQHSVRVIGESMGQTLLPRVLGGHYEGPFVNDQQCGALHREHFRQFRPIEDLDALPVVAAPDALHMMTLAPEVAGGIELIKELTKRGWVCSIGHTKAGFKTLDEARAAGARHLTHFMN